MVILDYTDSPLSYICTFMKSCFTFVLLLITLLTTFYPCCNVDNCCEDELTSTATKQNDQQPEGNCSPFISCGTCTGFTEMVMMPDIPHISVEKAVHHSRVISVSLSYYISSFLQPPRTA